MKRTFIPPDYRPCVPGTNLCENSRHNEFQTDSLRSILIIAAKEDVVPGGFLEDIADLANQTSQLFYDDLGISWDFSFYEDQLCIFQGEQKIFPSAIYHRHPGLKKTQANYHKHLAFLEALEQWPGQFFGQRNCHFHNSSKMFQLITSLRQARSDSSNVLFPYSFFIKGNFDAIANKPSHLIVKSCSSQRSKVATEEEFQNWEKKNIYNLPILFQEQLKGEDIRVHLCKNNFWVLKVLGKDYIDYRYSSVRVEYETVELDLTVQNFCLSLSKIEKNTFLGIDFMLFSNRYYCLESNPGPGWSTFKHFSKRGFSRNFFSNLTSKMNQKDEYYEKN